MTGSRRRTWQDNAVGLALVLGAGIGATIGVITGGGGGLALGIAFGAAAGLLVGAGIGNRNRG